MRRLAHSNAHGRLVTSCGDVARNPSHGPAPRHPKHQPLPVGNLQITSANITSLLSQVDVVTRLPGSILALQETRMGEGAQRCITLTI